MNQTESGADVEKDMDAALFILIKKRANAAVHLPVSPCIQIYKVLITSDWKRLLLHMRAARRSPLRWA